MTTPDSQPSLPPSYTPPHEPAFNIPGIVLAATLLLAAIHGVRSLIDPAADWLVLSNLAFVPARISLWLGQAELGEILGKVFGSAAATLDHSQLPPRLRPLLEANEFTPFTALSYGLLHGSLAHLITNGLWLIAFGSPVARRLGTSRFMFLILASTCGGAVAHFWVDPLALAPMIGASAAVSGATAAAARFVFAPGVRFGELGQDMKVRAIRAEPFLKLLFNPRAFAFIAFWFASNFLFGSGIISMNADEAIIAWQAHIGGFLVGLLLFPALDRPSHR